MTSLRTDKARIATIGMFDGVHLGHRSLVALLSEEGRRSGLTATVFTFAGHPLALIDPKAVPPALMPIDERVSELYRAGAEDVVTLDFTDDLRRMTARDFMGRLAGDYCVKALIMGFNHRFGSDMLVGRDAYAAIGKDVGIEVIFAGEWRCSDVAVSSSAIRQELSNGAVGAAAQMLGRPYRLYGMVVEGHRIGRQMGFPTANIKLDDRHQLVPLAGAYAVDTVLPGGVVRRGMLNIGTRPTVEHDMDALRSIEVNIFDWDGDLYGQGIKVDFIARLRDERKFASLDELRTQLEADREASNSL